jgi:superfamily II DNA or RNA helicase
MLSIAKKEKLLTKYNELAPIEKRILQLKALLFDIEYKTPFFDCIRSFELNKTKKTNLQQRQLNQILEKLIANNFIKKKSLAIESALFPHVFQDALQGEFGKLNLQTIKHAKGYRDKPHFNYEHYAYDLRAIRVAVYSNNSDVFTAANGIVPPAIYFNKLLEALNIYFPIVDFDWLNNLNPIIQLCFCLSRLMPQTSNLITTINNYNNWIDLYKIHRNLKLHNYLQYIKIQIEICIGDLEQAKLQTEKLSIESHYFYTSNGTLCFFSQNLEPAVNYYEKGLKVIRKEIKKRNFYINDFHGVFYLLTLIVQNDLIITKKALEILHKNYAEVEPLYAVIESLLFLQHGARQEAQNVINSIYASIHPQKKSKTKHGIPPLLLSFLGLIQYFVSIEKFKEKFMLICHEQFYSKNNYTLASHICAELLYAVEKKSLYNDFLQSSPFGIFRFLELIKIKPEWECVLDKLNNVLTPTINIDKNNGIISGGKRLVWLINPTSLDIGVIEQKQQANGNWSKGRNISIKRIYYNNLDLEYATSQDRLALKGIHLETYGWYGDESCCFKPHNTLPALIGHPNVYHMENKDIPIELVKGEIELNIEEVRNGYRFSLSHQANGAKVLLEKENQNRYKVISFSEQVVSLNNILPGIKGLVVPREAKEQVLKLIQQTSNNSIHINTDVGGLEIPTINGDYTCCVHLLPVGDGLKVNVGIRPFGDQGPFYKASQGAPSIIATIKNIDSTEKRIKAVRDFTNENNSVNNFIKNCPTLLEQDLGDFEWHFEELEECLEVLTEIEAYSTINIEWPQGQSLYIKKTVSAQDLLLKINSNQNWFEYEGEIELNDSKVISMELLLGLLENNNHGRFVKLNDGQFVALTNNFKKRLEELKTISEGNKVFHLGSGLLDTLAQEAKSLEIDNAWKKHVQQVKSMEKHSPKLPSTLQAILRDYQQEGFIYLSRLAHWNIGACLADDMGLGKTVQAIALILEQSAKGSTLVVAPTSVCFNWIDELANFAPTLNLYSLHENNDRENCIKKLKQRDVLICSYGLLQQAGDFLITKKWQTIILDEAQAIKNPQTKRWKYAVKLHGKCRLALTGTPIENHLGELWSIFRYLNPGLLGNSKSFQQNFANPIEKHKNNAAKNALKHLVQPYILRRLKSEVLEELPAKTEQIITIEPSEEEQAFYEALRRQALERINNVEVNNKNSKRFSILAEITKLRQACCHSSLVDGSINLENSKIKIFLDLVNKLVENKHKALIFSQYVRYLDKIKKILLEANITYQYIDGQTPAKKRKDAVEKFQSGEGDVFLLSLKAGGTGLNLTAADYVLHLDPWWNPAVEDGSSGI